MRAWRKKSITDVLFAKIAMLKIVNWRGILNHKFVVYHVQEMRELIQVKSSIYQMVHKGIEFRCDICGKDCVYKRGLQRHKGNVHEVRKGFKK